MNERQDEIDRLMSYVERLRLDNNDLAGCRSESARREMRANQQEIEALMEDVRFLNETTPMTVGDVSEQKLIELVPSL